MKKDKEKEQNEKMKALRKELEEKLEEQLPAELLTAEKDPSSPETEEVLDDARTKRVLEALLFASSKPLTIPEIRKVIKSSTPTQIRSMVEELRNEYAQEGRSFEVIDIATGFEINTKKEFAPWIYKLEVQKKARAVTHSALETLAILAYKQPVTRAEIEDLRGVDASGVLNTLMERGLIKIVGKKEVAGRPFLYSTTEKFLEHFGLNTLENLPGIDEIKALIETSVKKEELLGTQKLVEVPATEQEEQEQGV